MRIGPFKVVNLCPHPIRVRRGAQYLTIPKSGRVARLVFDSANPKRVDDIDFVATRVVCAKGLPEPQQGVLLVVSSMVRNAFAERDDLVSPALVQVGPDSVLYCEGLASNLGLTMRLVELSA